MLDKYREGENDMGMMDQDILKVLYTEKQIAARIESMGMEMYEDLKDKEPLFVSVLRGAFIFMADIVRACQVRSDVEFIAVSSYGNATTSSGAVQITHDIQQDITGRNLVVIEDILDSGNTLFFLKQYFLTKGAASVSICTLLDKPSRRTKAITADYVGFTVPDEFVVGYGLDYCQKYRNLPYIGVLKPEVYGGQ
jgi:hypoxanthine phosphoribosyltransferase